MKRFSSVEDAREALSYIDEDLAEIKSFLDKGNRAQALNMLDAIVRDAEFAAKQFPEMESEIDALAAKTAPYIKRIIATA